MTQEELKEAIEQSRRERVDVNIGEVSLRPTAQPGGQYNVQVETTPKQNALTDFANALRQFPQIYGQYANIQKEAGKKEIDELSPEELEDRAVNGDQDAKETVLNRFKLRGINEALFNARYETKIFPRMAAQEQEFKDMRPDAVEQFFQDENGNPIEDETEIIENLRLKYASLIPDDVRNNPNQKVMYNKLLRQLNGVATKSYAVLEQKRQKFLDESVYAGVNQNANTFNMGLPQTADEGNSEIVDPAGVNIVSRTGTMLPEIQYQNEEEAVKEPTTILGQISVYSPQKPGSKIGKMEGGYKAARPGADGENIVRTLEDFRKNPDTTVVTVAGNPEYYGQRYVVDSLTYQNAKGEQHTLTNVPVMVHDTGGRFKTTPEGRFDIPADRDLGNKSMAVNHGLLEGMRFIRDKASESGAKVKVKKTAKEATQQRIADIGFKQSTLVNGVIDEMNKTYFRGLEQMNRGSQVTQTQLRNSVEENFQEKLLDEIRQGNHVQVQAFVDAASGIDPDGKKMEPLKFQGEPISPRMLTTLSRAIEAQEDKLNREGPERTEKEKAALKNVRIALNKIAKDSPDVSLEETNEKREQLVLKFQKEVIDKGYSQDVLDDFRTDVGNFQSMLPLIGAGKNWNGVYESQAFIDDLDKQLDPGDKFITRLSGPEELLRVGEVADVDLSEIQLEPDALASLSPAKRTQWSNLTNMMTGTAATSAVGETSSEMAGLFQEAGEKDINANPLVPDQDEDGNRIEDDDGNPKMIRARELYPKLLRKHMTNALIREVNDTTKLKAMIDEARRIKGREVEAPKDPMASAILEEELGASDFLDEDGKTTNLSDYKKLLGPSLDIRKRNHLNRWTATASNPESLALMEDKTPRAKIDSDLESMVDIVSYSYLGRIGASINSKNKKPTERKKIRADLENQLKYTGIPMDVHEKNLLVKYSSSSPTTYGSRGGVYRPPSVYSTYDLNREDLYSQPKTAKTHVYNYQAIRDTREVSRSVSVSRQVKNTFRTPGNYEKLTILYNIHFKGQEESYPIETFFADQIALGKQLKFNPSK